MTLVEVLVALALLSLLSAGLVASFRVGHRTYDRLVEVDRAHWDVAVAQRFLRDTLESAYPFEPDAGAGSRVAGLEGSPQRLVVTAPGSLSDQATGLRRFSFFLQPRADGYEDLVAVSELDRNGRAASTAESKARAPETVVARVESVEWSFLERAEEGAWQSNWDAQRLPTLVRLKVVFPAGDSRRWPDLIVAPRITDDANCAFDVVSQACRQSQT
jgi:general secretion pathway protein J